MPRIGLCTLAMTNTQGRWLSFLHSLKSPHQTIRCYTSPTTSKLPDHLCLPVPDDWHLTAYGLPRGNLNTCSSCHYPPLFQCLVLFTWYLKTIPLPEKVQAIREFPQPQLQCQVRRFIGLVNFYHHFLPHTAESMQPLHSLLSAKDKSQPLI